MIGMLQRGAIDYAVPCLVAGAVTSPGRVATEESKQVSSSILPSPLGTCHSLESRWAAVRWSPVTGCIISILLRGRNFQELRVKSLVQER